MKILIMLVIFGLLATIVNAEESDAEQAVALLKKGESGVLATITVIDAEDGQPRIDRPYVSSTPFVINKKGELIIFISDLAVHTKNLNKNSNASIIVNRPDKTGDYFNGSRVTVNGKCLKVTDEKEIEACRKIYMGQYKAAEDWADFGDFNYYKLDPVEVYFIGGFGEINWIDLKEYREAAKK